MSTLIAMIVVVAASGMLLAYYLGLSTGRREGYEQGRKEGKREGSVRAFAVGFDRGKHQREVEAEKAEEAAAEESPSRLGCGVITLLVWTAGVVAVIAAVTAN